jgi:hypothetical protein
MFKRIKKEIEKNGIIETAEKYYESSQKIGLKRTQKEMLSVVSYVSKCSDLELKEIENKVFGVENGKRF